MSKHENFKRTAIVMALAASFPVTGFAEDDVKGLISPSVADVTLKLTDQNKVNPLYREYSGIDHTGNGSLDVNYVKRSDQGEWFKVKGANLGLTTAEFGASYEKQGDWKIGLDYNQIPHYGPYQVSTGVTGVGTNTITQPNLANGLFNAGGTLINPVLSDVTLKTQRDITTLSASKYLLEGLQLNFSFKNEDKKGTRMDGVRGVAGTGVPNLYSGFLFAPEPISQTHKQFDASLEYATNKYQVTAGYYGSFLTAANNALNVVQGTNTALVTAGLTPISLPPDNSVQQYYLTGAYNFTPATRGTLKVSYSMGKQNEPFIAGQPALTVAPANLQPLGSSLEGKVRTWEWFASLSSRITKDLNLSGSWRYKDQNDLTPLRMSTAPTSATSAIYGTNGQAYTSNYGKLEADYKFARGYALTAGIDYYDKENRRPESTSIGSAYSTTWPTATWEGLEWAREKLRETTGRLGVRKVMSETVTGSLTLSQSVRAGSTFAATDNIEPNYLLDRKRDKVRALVNWTPMEKLDFQASYAVYTDHFSAPATVIYGLRNAKGQDFSLDATYTLNDKWKFNGWLSRQDGDTNQNVNGQYCNTGAVNCPTSTTTPWTARLATVTDQFGLGATGKIQAFDVGASYLYSHDRGNQSLGAAGGFGAFGQGVMPDTKYTLNTLKLFGEYAFSKATKLRLDYVYDVRKMDDYTWRNWVYADGTTVYVNPNQSTQLIGISVTQSF